MAAAAATALFDGRGPSPPPLNLFFGSALVVRLAPSGKDRGGDPAPAATTLEASRSILILRSSDVSAVWVVAG